MPFLPLYLFITGWIILWPYLLCDIVNVLNKNSVKTENNLTKQLSC